MARACGAVGAAAVSLCVCLGSSGHGRNHRVSCSAAWKCMDAPPPTEGPRGATSELHASEGAALRTSAREVSGMDGVRTMSDAAERDGGRNATKRARQPEAQTTLGATAHSGAGGSIESREQGRSTGRCGSARQAGEAQSVRHSSSRRRAPDQNRSRRATARRAPQP